MKSRALFSLSALLLVACAAPAAAPSTDTSATVSSSSVSTTQTVMLVSPTDERLTLEVELATTPRSRERGLMDRTDLPENEGMLFVFPVAEYLSFWMKDTLIPLDIAYFDAGGRFVSSATMTPCPPMTPCSTYPSAAQALYALEVRDGSLGQWGVGEGWRLEAGVVSGVE